MKPANISLPCHPERLYVRDLLFRYAELHSEKADFSPDKIGFGMTILPPPRPAQIPQRRLKSLAAFIGLR
jgi:hypothetical protein